jgi:hypothetical protein
VPAVGLIGALRRELNATSADFVCAATDVDKLVDTAEVVPTEIRVEAEASIVTIAARTEEATASVTIFGNRCEVLPLRNWINVPLFMLPKSQSQDTPPPTHCQQMPNFEFDADTLVLSQVAEAYVPVFSVRDSTISDSRRRLAGRATMNE